MWEGLGCVGFVYKSLIVEIMAAASDNGGGRVLGLLRVERHGAGSNLAVYVHFFSCQISSKFWQFTFALDHVCIVTKLTLCMYTLLKAQIFVTCIFQQRSESICLRCTGKFTRYHCFYKLDA